MFRFMVRVLLRVGAMCPYDVSYFSYLSFSFSFCFYSSYLSFMCLVACVFILCVSVVYLDVLSTFPLPFHYLFYYCYSCICYSSCSFVFVIIMCGVIIRIMCGVCCVCVIVMVVVFLMCMCLVFLLDIIVCIVCY